ncbi:hypothetical protein DFJ77DRAFT_452116 [Powellomyces hirtus]|nr:hypothetical protein DFJ77DRAFT_452116 [Powellomyces hirtus]
MDDLGDLAWKSMGLAAKPTGRTGSTPLNQLSGTGGTSNAPSGSSTPQMMRTPPSYSPGNSASNTPRMAAATPFMPPSSQASPLGTAGATKAKPFGAATSSATHSRSASPGPNSILGGGGGGMGGKSQDVFGNLVSSFGGGFAAKPNLANMTMDQQRRYHEEQRQLAALQAQQQKAAAAANVSSGYNPTAAYGTGATPPLRPSPSTHIQPTPFNASSEAQNRSRATSNSPLDSGFSSNVFAQPHRSPAQPSPTAQQNILQPQRPTTAQSPPGPQDDAWNLDLLMGGGGATTFSPSARSSGSPASHSNSAHDPFDIGHLEQSSSSPAPEVSFDDNPLGLLAQPVSAMPKKPAQQGPINPPSPAPHPPVVAASAQSLPSTDNDFAIAQIVSMGFDDDSAATALAASGGDVQTAIDMLVQTRAAEQEMTSHPKPSGPPKGRSGGAPLGQHNRSHRVPKFKDDYEGTTSEDDEVLRKGPRGGPSRMTDYEHARSSSSGSASGAITQEKIIQTASAIGTSVFKNAKSMLAFSKQKISAAVEKAQAEIDGYAETSGRRPADGGRHRGGRDRHHHHQSDETRHEDEDRSERESYQAFRDDTDSDDDATAQRAHDQLSSDRSFGHKSPQATPQQQSRFRDDEPPHPFFSTETLPTQRQQPSSIPQHHQQQPYRPQQQQTPSKPTPLPVPTVTATPSQLAESNAHKENGNAHFKNGQFGDAEESYTLSINALPPKHLLLIPLYNNRAAARLKTGHYREAADDCTRVHEMDEKDLKSLLRRATAWEAMEKWENAVEDYRKVMGIDPSVKAASVGLGRCQKALRPTPPQPTPAATAATSSAPNVASQFAAFEDPFGTASGSMEPSVARAVDAAVQKLRDQNKATENEEDMKLALKDQTDDQINRWRRGKEDNLRALLSSLDMVLWAELEWKPINLSELITPQQVKIRYMKAVGRVHPDKLKQDATVEHRLIANGVFGTLNKGWDAFKAQNGLN